jgi:hypothetical protein
MTDAAIDFIIEAIANEKAGAPKDVVIDFALIDRASAGEQKIRP